MIRASSEGDTLSSLSSSLHSGDSSLQDDATEVVKDRYNSSRNQSIDSSISIIVQDCDAILNLQIFIADLATKVRVNRF